MKRPNLMIRTAWALLGTLATSASPVPPSGRALPRDASRSCLECHAKVGGLSHPIGVRAQPGRWAADLPLEPGGTVGCLTCHEERARDPAHALLADGDTLLRTRAQVLCSSCHQESDGPSHGLFLGRAHMLAGPGGPHAVDPDGFATEAMDHVSRACLTCHDGSMAPGAGVTDGPTRDLFRGNARGIQAEHPVGIRYQGSWAGMGPVTLRDASELPPEVHLVDGMVSCGSCHAPYSSRPAKLALDNHRGSLCLGCHIK